MKKTLKICTATTNAFVRFIALACVAVFIVLTCTACSSVGKYEDWMYFNKAVEIIDDVNDEKTEQVYGGLLRGHDYRNVREADGTYVGLFETVKENMRSKLGGYSGLNWERFERTKLVECDIDTPNLVAFFGRKEETVFLVSDQLPKTYDGMKELLAHELYHSLDRDLGCAFIEGTAEYVAQMLYPNSGSDRYYYHVKIVELFVEKYGMQGVIDLTADSKVLREAIDADFGRQETAFYLESILAVLQETTDMNTFRAFELSITDAMCHFAANTGCQKTEMHESYRGLAGTSATYDEAIKYFDWVLR